MISIPIRLLLALLNVAKSYARIAKQFDTERGELDDIIREAEIIYHATL